MRIDRACMKNALGKRLYLESITQGRKMLAQGYIPVVGDVACFSITAYLRALTFSKNRVPVFVTRATLDKYARRSII